MTRCGRDQGGTRQHWAGDIERGAVEQGRLETDAVLFSKMRTSEVTLATVMEWIDEQRTHDELSDASI